LIAFAPARRRGLEILDDPSVDPALAIRSLRDVAKANRLFGGRRAILLELESLAHRLPAHATLLDVGTGLGDIPAAAERAMARRDIRLTTIGIELDRHLAFEAAAACSLVVVGSATRLPFPSASVDVVTCSQVLHHFEGDDAIALLRECTRVARHAVIVGELRRSWLAMAGLWSMSFFLGFHPVSRHDGLVSIRRGFTTRDLRDLVRGSTGAQPRVRQRLGWRVTAVWPAAHTHTLAGDTHR
jgi:SAM-dependent methyltransferase